MSPSHRNYKLKICSSSEWKCKFKLIFACADWWKDIIPTPHPQKPGDKNAKELGLIHLRNNSFCTMNILKDLQNNIFSSYIAGQLLSIIRQIKYDMI